MKKSAVLNTLKNYKWQSVFVKYWICIFLALIIPIIAIFVTVTNHYNDVLLNQFENSAYEKLFSVRERFDNILNTIVLNHSAFVADTNNSFKFYALSDIEDISLLKKSISEIKDHINEPIMKNYDIDSVYFYCYKTNHIFSSSSAYPSDSSENFSDNSVFKMPNGIFERVLAHGNSSERYITYKEPVSFFNNVVSGIMVYNISCEALVKEFETASKSTFQIYLVNQSGDVIFTNDEKNNITNIDQDKIIKQIFEQNNSVVNLTKNQSEYIVATTIPSYPLSVIIRGEPTYYKTQQHYNLILMWIITILSLFAAVVISLFITSKFYNSIYEIILFLQHPFSSVNDKKKNDEINFIKDNIISIVEKNKKIEKELAERLLMLNDAQSIALETQLNPHFLFNTLQLISVMEMSKEQRETDITRAINLLADLLRYALDTTSRLVPLKTEIDYNKKYMAIQNIKYGNDFSVIWNIAPETNNLKILKLSIQPILENAISYGVSKLDGVKGYIVVSSEIKENKLIISVTDNGKQIPKEKLSQIRKNISEINLYKKNHIGLNNINQRIRLVFGDKYSVKINSDESGTKVTLTLPIVTD